MKKILFLTFFVIASASLMACASQQEAKDTTLNASQNADAPMADLQMPNPFKDVPTLEDAEKLAGFTFALPSTISSAYTNIDYRVLDSKKSMIEVIYKNIDGELRFRKGKVENISGVYTEFPTVHTVLLDNIKVSLKGNNDKVQLAEWKKEDFFYSIHVTAYNEKDFSTHGSLLREQVIDMIKNMLVK